MSIHSSFPADKAKQTDFAIPAPRRHDTIGRALDNAIARPDTTDMPDDMLALLAQLDRQSDHSGA